MAEERKKRALIIIDVQNDFCTGGALAVPQAEEVIPVINQLRESKAWDLVVLTQDWHPLDHVSFGSNHPGSTLFQPIQLSSGLQQMMWPNHCVQHSEGARFHGDLVVKDSDHVVQKGFEAGRDSYSGFFDNDHSTQTELHALLQRHAIEQVFAVGLALDYCVAYSALDAVRLGYQTFVISDATRGISPSSIASSLQQFETHAIQYIPSSDIPD